MKCNHVKKIIQSYSNKRFYIRRVICKNCREVLERKNRNIPENILDNENEGPEFLRKKVETLYTQKK